MAVSYTDEEIEEARQEALESLPEDTEPDAEFAVHEALDRAYIVLEFLEMTLMNHQTIIAHPEFYNPIHKMHTQLFNLYQEIGNLRWEKDKPGS